MIDKANAKRGQPSLSNLSFQADDILQAELEPADFIVAYYTVQFVRSSVH